jgi:tetratricopeptide (TPR) repeat protein
MEILDWIIHKTRLKDTENIDYIQLIQQLPGLSFVRRSGAGGHFVLHDEMRRLVTRYCWEIQDRDRGIRREISRCIISYCEQQQSEPKLLEAEDQLYTIMKLYHLLFSDLEEGQAHFQSVLRDAVSHWRGAFARSLLQETRPFAAEFSIRQNDEQVFAGALVLWTEENPVDALAEHERLKRDANSEWYAEREVEILIARGRCYLMLSQLSEASECFQQALDLGRARGDPSREAFLLDSLGFIHRRRGELERAMQYYNECIAIYKASGNPVQYANTLNNLSNVLRLKGNIEEALRVCKYALNSRRKLVQERKTSERAIAFSLSTLGLIYIDSESFGLAEQVLKEAIETSIHAKDTRNIAMGKVRLGRVYLAREELEQAKLLFEEAEKLSMDVNPEVLIASLNRQGRIYLRQGYWKEALPLLERALEVANHIHDHYQQVESLIDYATALEHLNQKDEAQQMWQKVQDIATQENYLTLAFLSLSDNLYWIKRELDFYPFLVRSI